MTKVKLLLIALLGCTGTIQGLNDDEPGVSVIEDRPSEPGEIVSPRRAVQRLSRMEIAAVAADVLEIDVREELELLPVDPSTPFDNDTANQIPSVGLVEGARSFSRRVADAYVSAPRLLERLGCSALDAECARDFLRGTGARLYRRSLLNDEVAEFVRLFESAPSPTVGMAMVLEVILQDPQFYYLIERPAPDGALSGEEVAARLALLVWGSVPDDELMRLGTDGSILDSEVRVAETVRMLDDERAHRQFTRFFSLWFGYASLSTESGSLSASMRQESDALVERVLFDQREPWTALFTSEETFVDPLLAEHYGMSSAGLAGGQWVRYAGDERRGLLSHASVLTNGQKFGDTSPVQRGLFFREQVLCQTIPLPEGVDVDMPPMVEDDPDACKSAEYASHSTNSVCASCHRQLDPIGFGLERYDGTGRYRQHEPERPDCPIEGEGELAPYGTFRGPAELSNLLIETDEFHRCAVTQFFRFAVGRHEHPEDDPLIDFFTERWLGGNSEFHELVTLVVAHPTFVQRVSE